MDADMVYRFTRAGAVKERSELGGEKWEESGAAARVCLGDDWFVGGESLS